LGVALWTVLFAQTSQAADGARNVILVHEAWADGSSWAKVIPLLETGELRVEMGRVVSTDHGRKSLSR